jgi:hypothetical protein
MKAFSQMARTVERPARVDGPVVEDCPLADRSPKTTGTSRTQAYRATLPKGFN